MAVQGNTLVRGAWVSTTFDVDDVLKAQKLAEEPRVMDVDKPPVLGILTQTVIRSPLVHWILPVKFRGPKIHDVALVGDDFVQIKELRPDGLLWDVIRKENFGSRIRNACVVGSIEAYGQDPDYRNGSPEIKEEDEDVLFSASSSPSRKPVAGVLPPQYLVIQLQSGDTVFLMLHLSSDGKLELVSSKYRISKKTFLDLQPGIHMAVDPSSRYTAIGGSEGMMAIYAINSREELKSQYSENPKLSYVGAETYLFFPGIIIKMDFLFPRPGDEGQIILLALVVLRGQTRMLVWEWKTGSDVKHIKARSQKGYPIEYGLRLPQLLIPLRTNSSFMLICEDSMAICHRLLEGSPEFTEFGGSIQTSSTHHGLGVPLWTSWAKPARTRSRRKTHEDIYIVREDGIIKILEIDTSDSSIGLDLNLGELGTNVGSAMACLDCWMPDRNGDLFVIGGDSCQGGTYLVHARRLPTFVEHIQNWSPAQDFVTTFEDPDKDTERRSSRSSNLLPKADRIFSCGGKGVKGAITEFRHGLEAIIGIEMDYEISISQAWVLYPEPENNEDRGTFMILMSVTDGTALLRFTDFNLDAESIDQDFTQLSLASRTIAAGIQGTAMVQVTERSIIIAFGSSSHTYDAAELLQVRFRDNLVGTGDSISNVAIGQHVVVFTTIINDSTWLQVLDKADDANSDSMEVDSGPALPTKGSVRPIGQFSVNVTALCIATRDSMRVAIVAELSGESLHLSFVPLERHQHQGVIQMVAITSAYGNNARLEGIVSIAVCPEESGRLLLLCGTRNGVLVTIELENGATEPATITHHKIGGTSVLLSADEYTQDLFFANCDSKVYAIRPQMSAPSAESSRRWLGQVQIHQVWLCSNDKPGYQPPNITSIVRLRPNLSGGIGGSMLFVSGTELLIARMSLQPKAVPRHLTIGCTPMRLIWSSRLNVLIVAASMNGKSTLLFIDPDTGDNLSQPVDSKTRDKIDFVNGLGREGERIFRLFEWTFKRNQSVWHYIIVCTSSGRVLVIALDNMDSIREDIILRSRIEPNDMDIPFTIPKRTKIRYLMKYKFKGREPAAAAVEFPEGIIWASGNRISIEALIDKKFQTVGKYKLPSAAIDITYKENKLFVLTKEHSLEVIEMVPQEEEEGYDLVRTHGDSMTRTALHHTTLDHPDTRPIHLVSDSMTSLVGLWPTEDTVADTLVSVFEAQLPYSVIRFRSARCRPIWDPVWSSSSRPAAETLGLSIGGAISHFTILAPATWEFCRFVVDLSMRSEVVCEFTYIKSEMPFERQTEPKRNMQIDGDILRGVLDERLLEGLLGIEEQVDMRDKRMVWERFVMMLKEVQREKGEEQRELLGMEEAIEVAYKLLAFLLRPVM